MRCPKCGYNSFEHNLSCPKCRKNLILVRQALSWGQSIPGNINFFPNAISEEELAVRPSGSQETFSLWQAKPLEPNGGQPGAVSIIDPPKIIVPLNDDDVISIPAPRTKTQVFDLNLPDEAPADLPINDTFEAMPQGLTEIVEGDESYTVSFEEILDEEQKNQSHSGEQALIVNEKQAEETAFEEKVIDFSIDEIKFGQAYEEEASDLTSAWPEEKVPEEDIEDLAVQEGDLLPPIDEPIMPQVPFTFFVNDDDDGPMSPTEEKIIGPEDIFKAHENLHLTENEHKETELELEALSDDEIFLLEDVEIKEQQLTEENLDFYSLDEEIEVELEEAEFKSPPEPLSGIHRDTMNLIQSNLAKTGDLPQAPTIKSKKSIH